MTKRLESTAVLQQWQMKLLLNVVRSEYMLYHVVCAAGLWYKPIRLYLFPPSAERHLPHFKVTLHSPAFDSTLISGWNFISCTLHDVFTSNKTWLCSFTMWASHNIRLNFYQRHTTVLSGLLLTHCEHLNKSSVNLLSALELFLTRTKQRKTYHIRLQPHMQSSLVSPKTNILENFWQD